MWWNFRNLLLALIILLGLFLRTFQIDSNPPGLTWDEAALGYNSYSILKTGKDEWGQFFPVIFKSFGDYKPGLYVYLAMPFVAILGLNEFSTRLPSILLGSLIPLVAFLFIRQLFGKEKEPIAIFSAFLLTVSPWAINFSRGAWETNIAFFEFLLGGYFLLKARDGKIRHLAISIIIFCLSIFTYQSAKMFGAVFPILIVLAFSNKFFTPKNRFKVGGIVLVLFIVLGLSVISPEVRSRLTVLNQSNYQRSEEEILKIKKDEPNISEPVFNLFHSERYEYVKIVTFHFLNYFSPTFLFLSGPPDSRQGVLNYGMMHLIEFPFVLMGIFYVFRNNFKGKKIIFIWLILAVAPSALSRDIINTVRSLPMVFVLEFFAAAGIYSFFNLLKSKKMFLYTGISILAVFFIFNLGFYYDRYYIHTPIHGSEYWLYGHKQTMLMVEANKQKYQSIIYTNKFNQPYIFYLFYNKYDPKKYQQQSAKFKVKGFDAEVTQIDNIKFRNLYWPDDRSLKNHLFFGSWLEIPDQDIDPKQSRIVKVIKFLDGTIAFKVAETR